MQLKLKLYYKKSTKNTYVFGNDEPEAPIPNVYIKRSVFSGDIPQTIILTVEDIKNEMDK